MQEGPLLMTKADRDRLVTLKKTKKGLIRQRDATEELGMSVRQVKRLLFAMKKRGDKAVVHGLRGKSSNRRIGADLGSITKVGHDLDLVLHRDVVGSGQYPSQALAEIDQGVAFGAHPAENLPHDAFHRLRGLLEASDALLHPGDEGGVVQVLRMRADEFPTAVDAVDGLERVQPSAKLVGGTSDDPAKGGEAPSLTTWATIQCSRMAACATLAAARLRMLASLWNASIRSPNTKRV